MEVLFRGTESNWIRKLQIPAGKATPAPPVGPALGQHGVNIAAFTKEFNERTKNDVGMIIPVIITVYADRSFTFITKTPPAADLLVSVAGVPAASNGHFSLRHRAAERGRDGSVRDRKSVV